MTHPDAAATAVRPRETCVNYIGTRAQHADKRIGDIMVRRPKSLPVDATVADARRLFENPNLLNLVLLEGSEFAGVIDRGSVPDSTPASAPIRPFAATDVQTTTPDAAVPDVLSTMDAGQLQRLVVLGDDGHTVAGLVCIDPTGDGFCAD